MIPKNIAIKKLILYRRHTKYVNTKMVTLMSIGRLLGNALKFISDNDGMEGSDGKLFHIVDATSTVYSFTRCIVPN